MTKLRCGCSYPRNTVVKLWAMQLTLLVIDYATWLLICKEKCLKMMDKLKLVIDNTKARLTLSHNEATALAYLENAHGALTAAKHHLIQAAKQLDDNSPAQHRCGISSGLCDTLLEWTECSIEEVKHRAKPRNS